MNVGSQCMQAEEHQQPGLSPPFWCLLALLSVTLAQDVARWSQDRACPAICYASASWALFWPKARLWTPTLSPSQKAIRDPAKLLITFWKKSVVKNWGFKKRVTSPPTVKREHELLQPTYRLWARAAAAMDQDVKYTNHREQNQFQSTILRNKFKMLFISYRLCFHVNSIFGGKRFTWNYPWTFGLIFQSRWAVIGTNYFSSSPCILASLWSAAVLRVLPVSP